jgi:hypothetical protein
MNGGMIYIGVLIGGLVAVGAIIWLMWWVEVGSARMHMRQAHREMKSMDWDRWPARVPYPPHPGHVKQPANPGPGIEPDQPWPRSSALLEAGAKSRRDDRREVLEPDMDPPASDQEMIATITSYAMNRYSVFDRAASKNRRLDGLRRARHAIDTFIQAVERERHI